MRYSFGFYHIGASVISVVATGALMLFRKTCWPLEVQEPRKPDLLVLYATFATPPMGSHIIVSGSLHDGSITRTFGDSLENRF